MIFLLYGAHRPVEGLAPEGQQRQPDHGVVRPAGRPARVLGRGGGAPGDSAAHVGDSAEQP